MLNLIPGLGSIDCLERNKWTCEARKHFSPQNQMKYWCLLQFFQFGCCIFRHAIHAKFDAFMPTPPKLKCVFVLDAYLIKYPTICEHSEQPSTAELKASLNRTKNIKAANGDLQLLFEPTNWDLCAVLPPPPGNTAWLNGKNKAMYKSWLFLSKGMQIHRRGGHSIG